MSVVEILRELVSIPSVSRLSNRPLINYVSSFLIEQSWSVKELPYRDKEGAEKVNLIAVPGEMPESPVAVDLAFACHTDTVPFSESWRNATQLEQRYGFLHGCGACDVKGSLAGILTAIAQCKLANIQRPVALLLTADEEIGCIGAAHMIASQQIRPRRVVICEPTSLHPATGGKGYGLLQVQITGHPAHSAFPQQGVSAIYAAANLIRRIEALSRSKSLLHDSLFDPPHTTFNIGTVQGGTAKNVIPEECTFLVEWRPIPGEEPARGAQHILQLAQEVELEHPGCKVTVTVQRSEKGFKNRKQSSLSNALSTLLGRSEMGISFGSEATRFAQIAEEVVVVGPGNMHTAHSERECVPIQELEQWTDCVKALLTP
jgi:acetylornithine deacetylase